MFFQTNSLGGASVFTPGNFATIVRLNKDHGTMSLRDLFAPAIEVARTGWNVSTFFPNRFIFIY
jgi:gamma-glutamyltranspeptidase